jgi:hypothetical protein
MKEAEEEEGCDPVGALSCWLLPQHSRGDEILGGPRDEAPLVTGTPTSCHLHSFLLSPEALAPETGLLSHCLIVNIEVFKWFWV